MAQPKTVGGIGAKTVQRARPDAWSVIVTARAAAAAAQALGGNRPTPAQTRRARPQHKMSRTVLSCYAGGRRAAEKQRKLTGFRVATRDTRSVD